MTKVFVISTILAGIIGGQVSAFTCRLVVMGQTYVDGVCEYQETSDGSFQFSAPSNPRLFVAVIRYEDGSAYGYWTGPGGASHAHDNLGPLSRDGACWINDQVVACAWQ